MSWYSAEDVSRHVKQVVVEVPRPKPVDSRFGMLFLGGKYHSLRSQTWTAGFFRLEYDPGPFFLVRGDGHAEGLRDEPFRVAFCFYRMDAGALLAVFVDFPQTQIARIPSAPYVLFEMIRGVDFEDERVRIRDAIERDHLHICFAEGDGPGEDLPGGGWTGAAINGCHDVLIELDSRCREALRVEWQALLDYHDALPLRSRDFDASVRQMSMENPLTRNPIVDRA